MKCREKNRKRNAKWGVCLVIFVCHWCVDVVSFLSFVFHQHIRSTGLGPRRIRRNKREEKKERERERKHERRHVRDSLDVGTLEGGEKKREKRFRIESPGLDCCQLISCQRKGHFFPWIFAIVQIKREKWTFGCEPSFVVSMIFSSPLSRFTERIDRPCSL